ncbi:hypothetical protein [Marispirochaeta sp.]|jgi:hypothetical protein|uniref:hypothetical protein n=1 Tax=Marispirochaeta sp. TaxID=2038653 RepID=UPI0029C9235C|nr:hypothetical protein [Marispirochaeta sp.]
MTKELLISAIVFGLFVVCPRMAGMTHILKNHTSAPLVITVLLGIAFSVPLLLLMIFVFSKFGVWGALGICVLTDLGAAFLMKEISITAGLETFIIAVFVIIGVKIAPVITGIAAGLFKG